MEHIKIAQVDKVQFLHHGKPTSGTLHITAHHIIFKSETPRSSPDGETTPSSTQAHPPEIWIAYPIIATAFRYPPSASAPPHIRLRNRDFSFLQFRFESERECRDVFDSIKALTVVKGGPEKLYAFYYQPNNAEKRFKGWEVYNAEREFRRQGVGTEQCKGWRITHINKDFEFSPTYPATICVPASISDTTLRHAKNYRSRARIPALTYIHRLNNCTLTRCAQPLTGVRGNRSIQDEKLVAAIFASSQPIGASNTPAHLRSSTPSPSSSSTALNPQADGHTPPVESPEAPPVRIYGAQQRSLIVDARPTVNAYAMQVVGMGTEDMDNYKHCSSPPCHRQFLGIDNIHVMRDSLNKVIDAIKDSDITSLPPSRELLQKSNWLKHIGLMLDGTALVVKQIAVDHAHALLHCSDGWDRTSQIASLAQICLDPYFRTIEGFMVLVEKDWVSFGHKFRDRSGYLGHDKWFIERNSYTATSTDETYAGDGADDEDYDNTRTPQRQASTLAAPEGAAAFGQALMGSARNFFTSGNNRANSPIPDDNDDPLSPGYADRRTKAARAIEHPTTKPKEVSPMFQQFLDATYQLMHQNPTRFEYNERFLRRLLFHVYSCQFGTFLYNNDKERVESRVKERTQSVWNYFLSRRKLWVSEKYDRNADRAGRDQGDGGVLFPLPQSAPNRVRWWAEIWGREDREMNGDPVPTPPPVAQMSRTNPQPLNPPAAVAMGGRSKSEEPQSGGGSSKPVALGLMEEQERSGEEGGGGTAIMMVNNTQKAMSSVVEGVRGLAMNVGGAARKRDSRSFDSAQEMVDM